MANSSQDRLQWLKILYMKDQIYLFIFNKTVPLSL